MPYSDDNQDPYVYPGTLILRNKLDIKDKENLDQAEAEIYDAKMRLAPPKGSFDYAHLQDLHKHLFGDVYDWAGQTRTVNIAKDTDYAGTTMFAYFNRIEPELMKVLTRLNNDPIVEDNHRDLCHRIAEYFNEINAAHPFREGNGRTNRLFCSEFAKQYGYTIQWRNMEKSDYINASIEGALNVNYDPMERLLLKNMIESKSYKNLSYDKEILSEEDRLVYERETKRLKKEAKDDLKNQQKPTFKP